MLLLLETDRRRKDDLAKRERDAAERQRIQQLHERHFETEAELRKRQDDLEDVLGRVEERLTMIEGSLLGGERANRAEKEGKRWRWL